MGLAQDWRFVSAVSKMIRRGCIAPTQAGMTVKVEGITSHPELNGMVGTLEEKDAGNAGRWKAWDVRANQRGHPIKCPSPRTPLALSATGT